MFSMELSDKEFLKFSKLVYEKCGINLHDGKKELVRARLSKRLRQTGIKDYKAYYKYLSEDESGQEINCLMDVISTNLTSFFREEKHFDFLRTKALPYYQQNGIKGLRLWSAGCSSGEESYSLAIALLEYFGERLPFKASILATDISSVVLSKAITGIYSQERLKRIPMPVIRKYFQKGYGKQSGNYRVKLIVRELIQFKYFNLMEPFQFNDPFNIIFCRNVMIYFDKNTQQLLVDKFYHSLAPGGYLLIGHSEGLTGIEHRFQYTGPSIYQKP
jgi:chemotaxis protein methyltransferase CheR